MSTVPSAPWARVHCATSPMSAPHRVHCALSPLPAPCQVLCFLGSCPMCPPAPCQPPPRFSVAWAHVHCALSPLSAPCQVFCLLGSCPLCPQPPVSPLPGLLSPGLVSTAPPAPCQPRIVSTAPSAPCPPPAKSSVSWAHVQCAPQPPVSPLLGFQLPGLMSTAPSAPSPPPAFLVSPAGLLFPGLTASAPSSAPCQVCLLGSCLLRPPPPVRPLPSLLSPALMSTVPPAACQPPARSSISWAHVHCALSPLSTPCQVFCLLGSCPLRHQPHVSPASCPPRPRGAAMPGFPEAVSRFPGPPRGSKGSPLGPGNFKKLRA